jgi:hypothetical protein
VELEVAAMGLTPRAAVNQWAVGFIGSAVIQGLFPRAFARRSRRDYNSGWQREIAIWNVGMLTTIAALRRQGADVDKGLMTGFMVLSALFGTNHLVAAAQAPRSVSNWIGAVANAVGVGTGLRVTAANRTRG